MRLVSLGHDLRLALRGLVREPAHSLVAILILAIGIGANTAVFSVVNPLLLKPLPFRDADRLVWIANTGQTGLSTTTFRVAAYEELARQSRSFEGMTAYFAFFGYISYTLSGSGDPERLVGVNIAPRFLELLGVQPQLGRGFAGDEWNQNGPRAVMLTPGLWQRRFAGDPSVVGRTVTINAQPYLVTGVLPDDFDFASTFTPGTRVDMLVPARLEEMRNWGNTLSIIGRLKPGVSIDTARAELATLVPSIVRTMDGYQFGTVVTDLKTQVSGPMRRALIVLWAAVGLVLLIVCANLSNLLLARTASRSKEFAVRVALGASRGRIVSQLLVEGLVLACCGAILGVPLAWALTSALKRSATLAVPLLHHVQVDGAALLATSAIAILSGLAFGAVPALRVAARPPQEALKAQGRGTTDGRQHARMRSTLVVAELALASVLLVGAGLLLKSFVHLLDVDLGFQPSRAVSFRVEVSGSGDITSQIADAPQQAERRRARLLDAARRVGELPGVEAAGITDALPLDRNRTWGIAVSGKVYPQGQFPGAFVYIVGPGYLRAMGIPLRRGRDFAEHDAPASPPVIILNESHARQHFGDEDPIGHVINVNGNPKTIVGIVADVRQTSLDETPANQMYLPYAHGGGVSSDLIVRSTLPASSLVPMVRAALAQIDSSLTVSEARPLEDLVDRAVSPRRFLLTLLGGFAGVGLLLASLGIYGVISYGVAQRVQEIGVRMALGATAANVRGQVLRETMQLALAGVAIGMVASFALARLIATLLYDTSPADPMAFGLTAALLLSVAALAGYVPAHQASRVDPMTALRAE
jgi:predicted permease